MRGRSRENSVGASAWLMAATSMTCRLGSRAEQLDEFVVDEPGFDELEPGFGCPHFGLTVVARAIRPMDPGLPNARDRPAKSAARPRVFEATDDAAGLHH